MRILEDCFNISPSIRADGVVHEIVGAFFGIPEFYRRFYMSPRMFEMIYHDVVECIMLSVTHAQPRTVKHVMPRSARAQPRTIFPSDSIISGIR